MKPTILINGAPVTPLRDADHAPIAAGLHSVLANGTSYEVRVNGSTITVNGHAFETEIQDPRRWSRQSASHGSQGRASINSPMPGKVVRILVELHQEVEAGKGIVVVEAMKMQNELKSPKPGKVVEIRVSENDGVAAGAVLVIIQ